MVDDLRNQLLQAIETDDRSLIESLLESQSELRDAINSRDFIRGKPILSFVRSVESVELMHWHGADFSQVEDWWAPGFGVRAMEPSVGRYLAEHGAKLTPHAASSMGLIDKLKAMFESDGSLLEAKGGDGGTPLHFARDLQTAKFLVERGAKIDPRDEDHNSTPAQWLIGDCREIAKYLIEQGASADIFMAAALGDQALVDQLIEANPDCLGYWVGKQPFPGIGYEDLGGTILQWSLGFNSFAHQYAAANGHQELFWSMYERSDLTTRFLVACVMAMRREAETILAENPGIVDSLADADLELLARYCWETNTNIDAVRLMLDVGFPIDHPETSHCYSPIHNAAFGGYADVVDLLIERGAAVDVEDPDFCSTPLGHAVYCCTEDGRHPEGEYGRVVKSLNEAGSPWEVTLYPTGSQQIDDILLPLLRGRLDGLALLGELAAVKKFLANSPRTEELTRALVAAANGGHAEICRRLIEAGAEQRIPEDGHWAPIHAAVSSGKCEVVQLMLDHGADILTPHGYGGNVLHTAGGQCAPREVIDLLLQNGADAGLNQKSTYGKTPLDVATEFGDPQTAEYLRQLGGKRGEDF